MFSKRKYKIILIILLISLIMGVTHAVYAEAVFTTPNINKEYSEWLELPEEEKEGKIAPDPIVRTYVKRDNTESIDIYNINNRIQSYSYSMNNLGSSLPNKYQTSGTIVKDQKSTKLCWAFSLNTVLELNLKITKGLDLDFSETHMGYATAKTTLNESEETVLNPIGFNRLADEGGHELIGIPYYLNGTGPTDEIQMPFSEKESTKLSEINDVITTAKVTDTINLPLLFKERIGNNITYSDGNGTIYTTQEVNEIRNMIKEHIYKYGAVTSRTLTSKIDDPAYQNNALNKYLKVDYVKNTSSYYCYDSKAGEDHALTIIGWDDTYSKDNFNSECKPTSDGAYICLNSWGEYALPGNGYIYVSYEDILIEKYTYGIKAADQKKTEKIYQHDFYGANWVIVPNNGANYLYGQNRFNITNVGQEYLKEIVIGLIEDQQIDLEVYDGATKILSKNLGIINAGYTTVKLDSPVLLQSSELKIIAKYTGIGKGSIVSVESNVYSSNVISNYGESYFSFDGLTWTDFKTEVENVNLSLKAITQTTDTSVAVKGVAFEESELSITKDKTKILKAHIIPSNATNQGLTWESSNTSVATVSDTGEIQTLSKGTTIITVKTKEGNKIAQCTINVLNPADIKLTSGLFGIEDGYVYGINICMPASIFMIFVESEGEIKIYNTNNVEINSSDIITTGMTLELENGVKYKLVVTGDLNGDGDFSLIDLSRMKLHTVSARVLEGAYLKAADVNTDKKVNLVDLSLIKLKIVGAI